MVALKDIIWEISLAVILGGIGLFIMFKLAQISNTDQSILWNGTTWVNTSNTSQAITSFTGAGNWSISSMTQFTDNVSLIGLVLVIGLVAAVLMKTKLFDR